LSGIKNGIFNFTAKPGKNASLERPHDLTSEGGALADIQEVVIPAKADHVGSEEVPNKPGDITIIKNN
jgi:hypothetical protein